MNIEGQAHQDSGSAKLLTSNEVCVQSPAFLIGGYGLGNYGDDLLMLTHLSVIRRVFRDDEILVTGGNAGQCYCNEMLPGPKYIPYADNIKVVTTVAIYGGGTQFYSFPGRKENYIAKLKRVFNGFVSGHIKISRLWTKKIPRVELRSADYIAATSIGLGPFISDELEKVAASKLGLCDLICVRDQVAYGYTEKWGLKNVKLRSDFVFAHKLWLDSASRSAVKSKAVKQVGLIPRDWRNTIDGAAHLHAMIQLASKLKSNNIEPVFYIFAPVTDRETLRAVRKSGFKYEEWNPKSSSIDEYTQLLGSCDLLVTARAHGAIVGSVLGIPSICAVIEPKLRIMSQLLGQGSEQWEAPFSVDEGISLIEKISGKLSMYQRAVSEACAKNEILATKATKELEEFLESTKNNKQKCRN